jgi:hypothetical protein
LFCSDYESTRDRKLPDNVNGATPSRPSFNDSLGPRHSTGARTKKSKRMGQRLARPPWWFS